MNNERAKLEARKERYLRDPLPARLGNLASNLARVNSIVTRPELGEASRRVIKESKHIVEWAGKDADLRLQVELVELQRLLVQWQFKWSEICNDPESRASVAAQAAVWSQKILENVLEMSDLLVSNEAIDNTLVVLKPLRVECSFCGKKQDEVDKIAGGAQGQICDRCVSTYLSAMRVTAQPEDSGAESPRCSFCGKAGEEAKAIFSQNISSICVDCLKTYEKIFSDESKP